MTWDTGHSRVFHFEWLFRNRPEVLLACGQNSASPLAAPPSSPSSHKTTICNDGRSVSIHWDEQCQSTFDSHWLLRFAQPDVVDGHPDRSIEPVPLRSRSGPADIPSLPFADLSSDGGVLSLLETLNRDGVAIVRGVPASHGAVLDLARRIGPVMRTIYGEVRRAQPAARAHAAKRVRCHCRRPARRRSRGGGAAAANAATGPHVSHQVQPGPVAGGGLRCSGAGCLTGVTADGDSGGSMARREGQGSSKTR
jgi:hypothetical protein